MAETSARPRAFLVRLLLLVLLAGGFLEAMAQAALAGFSPVLRVLQHGPSLLGAVASYWRLRAFCLRHGWLVAGCALVGTALFLLGVRQWLLVWNRLRGRITGTLARSVRLGFPVRQVDVIAGIRGRPAGQYFVGLTPRKTLIGWRWKPVYLSARERASHCHVIGKTGSGKTASVLWPLVLQDALDGKGILVLSAKGSDEEVATMKAIAALANRKEQLRVFCLPAWNVPSLFSHTYNLVYVRPRTATSPGGDAVAMAQRVFSILPMGKNAFFNTQAEVIFTNLCRLLHGIVDEVGVGIPYVVRDISICLKAIRNEGGWVRALDYCLDTSLDREAASLVQAQIRQLDREVLKCLSGLVGALDKFQSPVVNAYHPDIVFEEVLQANGMVYAQLPANLFRLQAPALGKAILMDVQQEGSLRQVFRAERNQTPFSVTVDEFYNFADLSIVDSLNKLRDANLHYTLAHQSLADLELVSKEFALAVWDNTRTKHILSQDNPELCERIAKSLGTHQVEELTVRKAHGPLFTTLSTGDASSRQVEAYRLHPNAIKNLARCGQGYVLSDEGLQAVAYGTLPTLVARYALKRNIQEKAAGLRLYERFVSEKAPVDSS